MTVEMYRLWTCNHCRVQEQTETNEQPEGWRGFSFTFPGVPLSSDAQMTGHLCPECSKTLLDGVGLHVSLGDGS